MYIYIFSSRNQRNSINTNSNIYDLTKTENYSCDIELNLSSDLMTTK